MKHFLFLTIIFLFIIGIRASEKDDEFDFEEIATEEEILDEPASKPKENKSEAKEVKVEIPSQKKYETPLISFDKDELLKEYATLFNNLKLNYVPHKVLSNLANDMEYTEGTSKRFLEAISFLDRRTLETLLTYYDQRESKYYKRLIKIINRKKQNRPDIPHARIIDEAVKYVYSRSKASLREQILLRINKLKNIPQKDLSSYSLDELIKEIESRSWNIKLERHPAHLKEKKVPLI